MTDSASSVNTAPSGEIEFDDRRVVGREDNHNDGSSTSSRKRIVCERMC